MQNVINTPFGYAIWCQRGRCYRCKDKKCACAHHSGGEADNDIVRECIAHGARRGPLQPYCQMGRHSECKRSHCMCDCHALGGVRPTPEPEPAPQTISVEGMDQEELQEALEQAFDKRAEPLRAEFSAIKDEWLAQSASLDEDIEEAKRAVAEADKVVKETAALAKVLDKARRIEIKMPKKAEPIDVGVQHAQFAHVLELLTLHENVWVKGPAGGGKTRAGRAWAKALGVPFYHIPIGPHATESKFLGYQNAMGEYIKSLARQGWEHGGLIMWDEIDRGNPAAITVINGMTGESNGDAIAGFADGMIKKHKDCYFVACANTYGRGADNLYVGAAQLDAATLNRYYVVDWETDWDFAAKLCGNAQWTDYVRRLHLAASALRLKVVIGMRDVLSGAKLLAAGIPQEEVEEGRFWRVISRDDKNKIMAKLPEVA